MASNDNDFAAAGWGDVNSTDPGTRRCKKLALQNVGPNNVSPTKGKTFDTQAGSTKPAAVDSETSFYDVRQSAHVPADASTEKFVEAGR